MHTAAIVFYATAFCLLLSIAKAENPVGRYFQRGNVTLYAETTGDMSDGPVMIFIHGSGGNAKSWSGVVDRYKREYSTVAFDLRGDGHSDKPFGAGSGSDYSFSMFSDDVHFILQQLGVNDIICFGQNFGSNICNQLEYDHNDTLTFSGSVLTGGNPLTVAATRTPTLTPSAAAWEFLEFNYTTHYQVCWIINSTIAMPNNIYYQAFLSEIGFQVFCDRCNNVNDLRNYFVTANSNGEPPLFQMWKLGCFGANPTAWPFNSQFHMLPVLANNWVPRQVIAGSENMGFSRGYTYYLATKLMPTIRRPGALDDRPAGYSTPLLTTAVGRGNFVATTDIKMYTAIVDEYLDYKWYGPELQKCDVVKV
jgi:pimeloyl-ACP methyl ester carboxylesterase